MIKGATALLSKYDAEALDLKIWVERLQAQETELVGIKKIVRTDPAVKNELEKYRRRRKRLLAVLSTYLLGMNKAMIDLSDSGLHRVITFLNGHLSGIAADNGKKLDEKVLQLIQEYDTDETLRTALSEAGVQRYLDELKAVQENIISCKAALVEFRGKQPRVRTNEIKRRSVVLLNELLAAIELSQIRHPEKDYLPLKNELNAFLSEYKALDKTRRTLSRKATEEKKSAALSGKTSAADK